MDREFCDGKAAFLSDEFRIFAVKWLGFDPHEVAERSRINHFSLEMLMDGVALYQLKCAALREVEKRPGGAR